MTRTAELAALSAEKFHDAWVERGMRCAGTHSIGEGLCQNVVAVLAALRAVPRPSEEIAAIAQDQAWGSGYAAGRAAPRPAVRDGLREAALTKIARAEQAVDDLCQGKLRWEMRVPAEPDHDPDLIISEALRAAHAALADKGSREAGELDVERLARAIAASEDGFDFGGSADLDLNREHYGSARELAAEIIRHYREASEA